MKIFIVNGKPKSGKTTWEKFVKAIAWQTNEEVVSVFSIIDHVKHTALSLGWDGEKDARGRKFLYELKQTLAHYNDSPYQEVKRHIEDCEQKGIIALFVDMREASDALRLKEEFGAKTIFIERNQEEVDWGNAADNLTKEIFYDIIISNETNDLHDLEEKAKDFYIEYIKGEEE